MLAKILLLLLLCGSGSIVVYAREFNINCNSNLVMYWGQNSRGVTNPGENQLPLDEYCDKESGDVLVLSFLSEFNADGLHPPGLNLANACVTTFTNTTLLHCPNIGKAITHCQKQGKVVLLSMGGAAGAYGFADDTQAERYADRLWDLFLGGNSMTRPFDDAIIDGVDLDIEGGSSVGYVRFVQRMRERFVEIPNRRFFLSAAPQCPYPDFYTGPVLDNAYLDMVFVQFYNNYCGVDKPNWFNYEQWHNWATNVAPNKDVRIYMGVPGSPSAASTGYIDGGALEEIVNATRKQFNTFGGLMVWDASQAETNRVSQDFTFARMAAKLLDSGKKCTDGSVPTNVVPVIETQTTTDMVSHTEVITTTANNTAYSSSQSTGYASSSTAIGVSSSSSVSATESSETSASKSETGNSSSGSKDSAHDAKTIVLPPLKPNTSPTSSSSSSSSSDTTTAAEPPKAILSTILDENGEETVITNFLVTGSKAAGSPGSSSSSSSDTATTTKPPKAILSTIIDENGAKTVITNFLVTGSKVAESSDSSSSSSSDTTTAAEPSKAILSTILDENGEETVITNFLVTGSKEAGSSPATSDSESSTSESDIPVAEAGNATDSTDATSDSTEGTANGSSTTATDSTDTDSNADNSSTDASSTLSRTNVDDGPVTVDVTVTGDGMETSSTVTTKFIHKTSTKTRRVHLVTRHVTKRVHKFTNAAGVETLEGTATPTNKTTSIVTPTFPLPIARCPRADQPCVGAGFACNGYEFGQCINNRWLMRPCSTDRVTACFNAGPDLIACDFTKGRSLQVCDDILAPLPFGRLASNVLFLRATDQERALNTPVYPVPSSTPLTTTKEPKRKKKKDDDDDDDNDSDTEDDDDDYVYNKYGEKKKNTLTTSSATNMELIKESSGVNLIDDHNRREDPAMLMAKDPEAYYGPDGHVRAVGGNVVDDMRKHAKYNPKNEPYDENPPVDDPEEGDEYSEGDEFMRKRDYGAWDEEEMTDSSAPLAAPISSMVYGADEHGQLVKRGTGDLTGAGVSMAHLNDKDWRSQLEDFYAIYALYAALAGASQDMQRQQFERVMLDHIDGDFLIPPRMTIKSGFPMLARFTFVPMRGEDKDFLHYRTKDGMVEEDVLVIVRMLTNEPIPKRWRIALPLNLNTTMLHTSRGMFFSGENVSPELKSIYQQRVSFYNKHIRINTNKKQSGVENQRLDDLAAGHSSNDTSVRSDSNDFAKGPDDSNLKRNLITPSVISQILHSKPDDPLPPELLYEPIPDDPAGRLYEVRSNPETEGDKKMAIYFTIRVKTRPAPGSHVVSALPHPILSFITTY